MIRVGLIGYGNAAKTFHLPLIQALDEFRLVALSTSQIGLHIPEHPTLTIYPTAQQLISDAAIDVVIITAPNAVHFELAKQALERGLHVVLEKPMAISVAQADALCRLASKKDRLLTVFHNRRWDGDFLAVKALIESGSLGDVRTFESHFDRFRPTAQDRWRENPGAGNGFWFDLGSHLVDQALCLFGWPQSLTARLLMLRPNARNTDYFHVVLHYPSCEVILHSSPFCAGPNPRFRVEGSKGSYIKLGLDPQEDQLKAGLSPLSTGFGLEPAQHFGTLYNGAEQRRIETLPGVYLDFYRQLGSALSSQDFHRAPVDALQAADVIALLELAESSSKQSVTLPAHRQRLP